MKNYGVCLLNDTFPPVIDGVANTLLNYARVIHADGGTPYVLTPRYPGVDDSIYPYRVIRYAGLDTRESLGYVAGYPFDAKVAQELENKDVRIIHTHCPFASTVLARSLREIIHAPLIFTYHTKFDFDIQKIVSNRLIQDTAVRLVTSNIKACDEVWVVSRGAGENMRQLIGADIDYYVMENGVDLPKMRLSDEETEKLTAEYKLPAGVPVFIFVGRMMWYKNIRITIDALAGIHSQGKDFRMMFVGGGTDEEEIKKYCEQVGIAGKCIFCGRVYDRRKLQALYCRANLMMFPSTYDTNGLVVREAAACSLASVLVDGSCAAEGTTADQNCFKITESAASMAALLMRIIDYPDFMKKVGENAADQIYISWEEAVHRAEDRYELVLDNYRSGKYRVKHSVSREYIKFSAEIMDALGSIYGAIKRFQEDESPLS